MPQKVRHYLGLFLWKKVKYDCKAITLKQAYFKLKQPFYKTHTCLNKNESDKISNSLVSK